MSIETMEPADARLERLLVLSQALIGLVQRDASGACVSPSRIDTCAAALL